MKLPFPQKLYNDACLMLGGQTTAVPTTASQTTAAQGSTTTASGSTAAIVTRPGCGPITSADLATGQASQDKNRMDPEEEREQMKRGLAMETSSNRSATSRLFLKSVVKRWPNSVVPYIVRFWIEYIFHDSIFNLVPLSVVASMLSREV